MKRLVIFLGIFPVWAQSHYVQMDVKVQGESVAQAIAYFADNGQSQDLYLYCQGRFDNEFTLIGVMKQKGSAVCFNGSDSAGFWDAFAKRNAITGTLRFFKVTAADGWEELQLDLAGSASYSIRAHHVIDDYCGTGRPKWPIPLGVTITPEPICIYCGDPDPQPMRQFLGAMTVSPLLDSAFSLGRMGIDLEDGVASLELPRRMGKVADQQLEATLQSLIPNGQ